MTEHAIRVAEELKKRGKDACECRPGEFGEIVQKAIDDM